MSYSVDLRKRVLAAVDDGMRREDVAATFQVGRATITRWLTLRRATNALVARTSPGRPRVIAKTDDAALVTQVQAAADARLREHVEAWHATHTCRPSIATMSRALARVGWTRKKRRSTPMNKIVLPDVRIVTVSTPVRPPTLS